MNSLKRKTAVVTGASSGIGKATMQLMLAAGHRVLATARTERDLASIRAAGAEGFLLELSSKESVAACAAAILAATDHIDVLFNNAGYGLQVAMEDASFDALSHQLLVNVVGPSAFTNLLVQRLSVGGLLIFNSSILGRLVLPFRGPYACSKYAIEAAADAYRLELRSRRIRVHVIEPGPVVASFRRSALKALQDCLGRESPRLDYSRHRARLDAAQPSAGAVPAESVAGVVLDLMDGRKRSARILLGRAARVSAALKWLLGSRFDHIALRTEPVREIPTASTHPPYTSR